MASASMVLRSGAQASVVACASSSSAAATRASQVPTLAPRPLAGTAWSAAYSREGRTQMRLQVARRDEQQPQRQDRSPSPARAPVPVPAAAAEADNDSSLFFTEPLLRGLVLGVGAGVLCELVHVALKVGDIASDNAGWHLPSIAAMYEHLRPLFVVDHVAAFSFWLLFYLIEAAAILTILRKYPDDSKEAAKVIKTTKTLPQMLMPLKLSSARRALHALITGKQPTAVAAQHGAAAAPLAFRDGGAMPSLPGPRPSGLGGGAGTAVLERPRPTDEAARPKPLPKKKEEEDKDVASTTAPAPAKPAAPRGGAASAGKRAASGFKPGQLDPTSPLLQPTKKPASQAEKRAKQLKDRNAYLKNFWYAAGLSEKITSKPTKVEILSRTVTIWRDEKTGAVHCLDNVCPHRGAPLSMGWSKEHNGKSCVVCPYHGWAFDGQGKLQDVPSQDPSTAFPSRPVVDSYPVEERGGFVWLFFGSKSLPKDERPPIPIVPELEDPNWRAVYGEMEFDCAHWSVFENALDMAHIHYLHDGSFGDQANPVIHDMVVTRDTWNITANFSIHNKPVNPLWNWTKVPVVPVEARAYLPSTSYVKIMLGNGVQMITYVCTTPIDEHRAINRFTLLRNFAHSPLFDNYTRKSMYKILGEDKVMIERLQPEQIRQELSLEADKPQLAFRKLRQEWIDMGYGQDPEPIASHKGSLNTDF